MSLWPSTLRLLSPDSPRQFGYREQVVSLKYHSIGTNIAKSFTRQHILLWSRAMLRIGSSSLCDLWYSLQKITPGGIGLMGEITRLQEFGSDLVTSTSPDFHSAYGTCSLTSFQRVSIRSCSAVYHKISIVGMIGLFKFLLELALSWGDMVWNLQ